MIKSNTGITNPDGTPRFHYELTQAELDDGYAVFVTGPIAGDIAVAGTAYDVSEGAIPVKVEHVGALHIAIHKAHHAAGRFLDVPVPDVKDVSLKVA
jgi:hypothetical protein